MTGPGHRTARPGKSPGVVEVRDPPSETPQTLVLPVLGHRVSMLVARAAEPRAVVFALHGGNSGKEYFDSPVAPSLSLLRLGPSLGFTVVAPDRPGYGAAKTAGELPVAARTALMHAALDAATDCSSNGGGVFVLAHSAGCASALRMAAGERGHELLGIELSGTGLRTSPSAQRLAELGPDRIDGRSLGRLIWGADDLYPVGTRQALAGRSGTQVEMADAKGWGVELPRLAPRVTVPVRYTLAEHESWWRPGNEGLAEVAALFTGAPMVETAIETGGGHNLSVGRTARAYHLRVLAFAESCLARRSGGDAGPSGGDAV